MIYKINQGIDVGHSYDPSYDIFLKEDDIDYIENTEKKIYGNLTIHLKREMTFVTGQEPTKVIYIKNYPDMVPFNGI